MPEVRIEGVNRGRLLKNVGGGFTGRKEYAVVARLKGRPDLLVGATVRLVQGTYKVTELRVVAAGDEAVTSEVLRVIPLQSIVDATAGRDLRRLNLDRQFDLKNPSGDPNAEVRETAFVYRLARLLGEAPTKAVMEHFGVSRATASRKVAAARRTGHLKAEEAGAAGGARSQVELKRGQH